MHGHVSTLLPFEAQFVFFQCVYHSTKDQNTALDLDVKYATCGGSFVDYGTNVK